MTAATNLLDRLEAVRPIGSGRWVAKCPAHQDKRPSLSIRELDDGRLLLHDFGGCPIGDVLTALGLGMSDLFEKPLTREGLAPSHSRIPARDLLEIICEETSVIAIIAADMLEQREIGQADWKRLSTAASRIGRARDHAYGR